MQKASYVNGFESVLCFVITASDSRYVSGERIPVEILEFPPEILALPPVYSISS